MGWLHHHTNDASTPVHEDRACGWFAITTVQPGEGDAIFLCISVSTCVTYNIYHGMPRRSYVMDHMFVISTNPEQVVACIASFGLCSQISIAVGDMYNVDKETASSPTKEKEERGMGQDLYFAFSLSELSPVPPSLIDEYGFIRKRNKAVLVSFHSVIIQISPPPDTLLVDVSHLLYHIV